MKTIIITGNFSNNGNNLVTVEIFRPNSLPNPYDFRKTYDRSFVETLNDLQEDTVYHIDFAGHTPGDFDIVIEGEFENPNPIVDGFKATGFNAGYTINTLR